MGSLPEQSLASRNLFSLDILKQSLEQMSQLLHAPKGSVLFNQGDLPEVIYYMFSGKVRLSVERPDREPLTVRIVGPGEVLELGSLFTDRPYQITAEALTESYLGFIRKETLLRYLGEHVEARLPLLRLLSHDVSRNIHALRAAI